MAYRQQTANSEFHSRMLHSGSWIGSRAPYLDELHQALDVGSNSGHNAIQLADQYGMDVVGIDIQPRHIEVSRFLAEVANVQVEFLQGEAESWVRPEDFDLVIHFGTLYHLPNPLLAIETAARNLRPGGWLGLETQVYDDPSDPNLCYWIHGRNNDLSNFWALSTAVLDTCLRRVGFEDPVECFRVSPDRLPDRMSRIVVAARKAL